MIKHTILKLQGVLSYFLYVPLFPLLPVIFRQGKSVKANTLRLPEADGLRHSVVQNSVAENSDAVIRHRSLLHIGESTVAGVGVKSFEEGLTANIIRDLNSGSQQAWLWQAIGKNGAVAIDLSKHIAETELHRAPDVILLTMGVNDTTSFTTASVWQKSLVGCIENITSAFNSTPKVCVTQVPPMHLFPALPFPLNVFLGLRAWQLDNRLRQVCLLEGWSHLTIEMPLQKEWMAEDGYHPNAEGYKLWAEKISALLPSYK